MSFLEKLKRGVGVDIDEENVTEGKKEKPKKPTKEIKTQKEVVQKHKEEPKPIKEESIWDSKSEGQLVIDLYETDDYFVIQSAIAGIKTEDLDISIENGIVTIRGEREKCIEEEDKKSKYIYQECHWGSFSRQVILPGEIDNSKTEASMKEGILTLRIPKIKKKSKKKITIKEEETKE